MSEDEIDFSAINKAFTEIFREIFRMLDYIDIKFRVKKIVFLVVILLILAIFKGIETAGSFMLIMIVCQTSVNAMKMKDRLLFDVIVHAVLAKDTKQSPENYAKLHNLKRDQWL